jgi:hypothetical protein
LALEKIYGNLGDVVAYEERLLNENRNGGGARQMSPSESLVTLKRAGKRDRSDNRRMTGLEAIYLQKFDKKTSSNARKNHHSQAGRAKFRNTIQ